MSMRNGRIPAPGPRRKAKTNQKKKSGSSPFTRTVSAPVAMAQSQSFVGNSTSISSRRITNKELVSTIIGNNGPFGGVGGTTSIILNPGIPLSFPWLSVQAAQYQQYRFHKLIFRYVTRSSTAQTGSIIMSPDYNSTDLLPTSEAEATNTQNAVEGVTWNQLDCVLDPRAMFPNGPRKQIRTHVQSGDPQTYDAGRLYVFNFDNTIVSAVGKLWVEYDVELFVPQSSSLQAIRPTGTNFFTRNTDQLLVTTVASNVSFDDVTTIVGQNGFNPLRCSFNPVVGNFASIIPLAGSYYFQFCTSVRAVGVGGTLQVLSQILVNGVAAPIDVISSSSTDFLPAGLGVVNVTIDQVINVIAGDIITVSITATSPGVININGRGTSLIMTAA